MSKQKNNASKRRYADTSVKNTPPQYKTENRPVNTVFDGFLPIIAVLTLTFLAFIPTFQNQFVNWDDDVNILKNVFINDLSFENIKNIFSSNVMGGYNPLSILTFAVEKAVFGNDNLALVIHTDNLILHLICVFFVWRIVRGLGFNALTALVVALLFGIHPMRVESVAWATERKDVLFGTFYFAAIFQYIKYVKSNSYTLLNKNFVYTFVLFCFALFSKVQAVSLPLSLLAVDYFLKRPLHFKLVLEKIHFFIGSLIYGCLTIVLLKNAKTITEDTVLYNGLERIVIGFHTYAVYVGKCIFPWVMSPLYAYPATISADMYINSLLLIVSFVGIVWAYRKGFTVLVFGWIFFFVNFIFVAQIVGAGQGYLADRFTYVPYFGFFLIFAFYTEGVLARSFMAQLAFSLYVIACFYTTFTHVKTWKNSDTLWTQALEYDAKSTTAWRNRALFFREEKQFKRALGNLDTALMIKPSADTYNSRGKTYLDMGNAIGTINDCTMAIKMDTKLAEVWANRGAAYGQLNKLDSAMADLSQALILDSLHANALMNRGNVYSVLGQRAEAIRDFTKALDIEPTNLAALLNRSLTYREMGRFDLALGDCDRYLAFKKDNANVWIDRAMLKKQLGRCVEAIPDFDEALRQNGLDGAVYVERAKCFKALGNTAAMRTDIQKAQSLGVKNIDSTLF